MITTKLQMTTFFCLLVAGPAVLAATYYVDKTGSDGNNGSSASPWRTIQKASDTATAGDTVIIKQGVYKEVLTTGNPGSASNRIVYKAQGDVTVHRVVVSHPYNTVQDLRVSGYTNTWFHGLVDIEAGAHWTTISGCSIEPTIPFLGGLEMSQAKLDPFDDDAPSNCLVVSNDITGVIGRVGFNIFGANNLFLANTVTNLYKSDFVRLWGRSNIIRNNTFAHMLDHEINNHVDFIQTFGQNGDGSKDHIIEGNLVLDIPNGQMAQLTRSDGVSDPLGNTPSEMGGWTFRNNVFVDIAKQSSCSIPDMKYYNNVFYRCNYDGGHALAFGHSARGSAEGFRIYNNVFLECGSPGSSNTGWYSSLRPDGSSWNDARFDFNYVAMDDFQPVRTQIPPTAFRWHEPNGINGGDTRFVNLAALDFRLLEDSLLIDNGVALSGFNVDRDGDARPHGAGWDIGPDEFSGQAPPPTVEATYYVSVTGSDSNPGTQSSPWRTIQKGADNATAGDIVVVSAGDYGEYVTTKASGTAGNPIIYRAIGAVSTRAFRVLNHQYVTIDGFQLTGSQNLWGTHVRIEPQSHFTVVTNCVIGPGVFTISDDFTFNASDDSVSSPSVDFIASGFRAGGKVFLGGSGVEEYWFNNHDTAHVISSVAKTKLVFSTSLLTETENPAWAPIYAGSNSAGTEGINFIISGGKSASNCTFVGNTFTNLFGCPITLQGENHVVANNTFTRLNSYYGIRPNGSGHKIHDNFWYDCVNFLHYTPTELGEIPHPPDASWYDYQVGFIHVPGFGQNVEFYNNWLENVHNPLGQINEVPGAYGFTIRNNVFVGVAENMSGGRNGMTIESNTFYRCAYNWPAGQALTVGGNSSSSPAEDIVIRGNAFIDVGSRRNLKLEGAYSLVNSVNSEADNNFITGPETVGWPEMVAYSEPSGVNGGDPLLLDPDNPRGPDGIPFTSDDGLRPLPNSPMAQSGFGALSAVEVTAGEPISHFTVSAISSGLQWYDKVGYEFDPVWETLPPFDRKEKVRPYDVPEALGSAPVTVTFSASDSISNVSGNSTDWNGITAFQWSFGDGGTAFTTEPTVQHTFNSGGQFTVSLSVRVANGNIDTSKKVYRVLGDVAPPAPRPLPPTNIQILEE